MIWTVFNKRIFLVIAIRDKKIDLSQEMRNQLGSGGLVSQNQINVNRENQLLGQWKHLVKRASSGSLHGAQQPLVSIGARGNQEQQYESIFFFCELMNWLFD